MNCPRCGRTVKVTPSATIVFGEGGTYRCTDDCVEIQRLRAALEAITQSHPALVTRGGGPAPWLIAKAALLNIPLGDGYEAHDRAHNAVLAEWAKTEPRVRR